MNISQLSRKSYSRENLRNHGISVVSPSNKHGRKSVSPLRNISSQMNYSNKMNTTLESISPRKLPKSQKLSIFNKENPLEEAKRK